MIGHALFFVFPVIVILAGITDMMTMTISNRFSLALIGAFVVLAPLVLGMNVTDWGSHVAAGALTLLVTFAMFAFGWIGGGDAKFAAAIGLWLGLPQLLGFAVLTSIFGGGLTLGMLIFAKLPVPLAALRVTWIDRIHGLNAGIPYGLALAAAGLVTYPDSIWFTLLS